MVRFCMDKPLIILHHLLVPLVGFPALMISRYFIFIKNYNLSLSLSKCYLLLPWDVHYFVFKRSLPTLLRELCVPKIPVARPPFQIPNSYSQNKFYNSMWSIFTKEAEG